MTDSLLHMIAHGPRTFIESGAGFLPADRRLARTTVTALAVGALVGMDCVARRPDRGAGRGAA